MVLVLKRLNVSFSCGDSPFINPLREKEEGAFSRQSMTSAVNGFELTSSNHRLPMSMYSLQAVTLSDARTNIFTYVNVLASRLCAVSLAHVAEFQTDSIFLNFISHLIHFSIRSCSQIEFISCLISF